MKQAVMRWFIELQAMIDPFSFIGQPIPFNNICKVYPPRINDILGELNYPVYKKIFLSTQEDIEDEFTEKRLPMDNIPTPIEYLFNLSKSDERIKQIALEGITFFTKEPATMLMDQQIIIIGDINNILSSIQSIEELRIINKDNYFEFQNLLRRAIGEKEAEPYNPEENPRVKYFKAKARLRDRVKAKSKDGLTLGTTLASICCMGIGITPLNVGELSQSAISVLMRTYQEKHKYEIDVESLMNGADSKKVKPQFWIRNIEDL